MSDDFSIYQVAAYLVVTHVDEMPTARERAELAGAFAFAAVDVLKHLVGDESTLNALRMMTEAIESKKGAPH